MTFVTIWQRWLRQPQSTWVRRALFQVHLWSGLVLAAYLAMLSVTGSILVFRLELDRALATPRPAFDPARPTLSSADMAAAVRRAYPDAALRSQSERVTARSPAVQVALERDGEEIRRVFDPYTGADLGPAFTRGQDLLLMIVRLHDDLLFGRDGRWWNGVGSAVITLLVLTGLVVWWPGVARWRRSTKIALSGGWRRIAWDVHSAAGFWLFGFLLIWGVSGFYLGVPYPFTRLVELLEPTGSGESGGDWVLMWLTRLHFGRWRDPWLQGLWAVLGLVPALMVVTAVVMWWNRVLRPWRAARRKPAGVGDLDRVRIDTVRP